MYFLFAPPFFDGGHLDFDGIGEAEFFDLGGCEDWGVRDGGEIVGDEPIGFLVGFPTESIKARKIDRF